MIDRGRLKLVQTPYVLVRGRHILPADTSAGGVRAASEPEPLPIPPVFDVVTRTPSGTRDVGDLVLLVPGRVQSFHRRQIHHRRVIVGRLRPSGAEHVLLERSIGIYLE